MTTNISFNPFLGWVDITDPANIPANARLISAADLLRYENFANAAAPLLNTIGNLAQSNQNAINSLTNTVNTQATSINNAGNLAQSASNSANKNASDIAALKAPAVATKTANYALTATDGIVIGNAAALTLTLPAASTSTPGQKFTLKNINAAALTVASAGGTIDGAVTATLAQWQAGKYISDGTNWLSV